MRIDLHTHSSASDGTDTEISGDVKAGDVVAHIAQQIDGKGGGRPDMAQGGGLDIAQLPALLEALPDWIGQRLERAAAS